MLAACFGIRAPPAEVGDIFLPRYITQLNIYIIKGAVAHNERAAASFLCKKIIPGLGVEFRYAKTKFTERL